jgi:hypothetical protein
MINFWMRSKNLPRNRKKLPNPYFCCHADEIFVIFAYFENRDERKDEVLNQIQTF